MDKLYFFSRSKDVPPGKGTHEFVSNPDDYVDLQKIPDWRRVLSNFHEFDFEYEGRKYRTVEHAFQASKLRLADPWKADNLSLDSESEVAMGDGLEARRKRKWAILNSEQLRTWNEIKGSVMKNILETKAKSCEQLRNVLVATKSAQLWHSAPRIRAERMTHLEEIRRRMSEFWGGLTSHVKPESLVQLRRFESNSA